MNITTIENEISAFTDEYFEEIQIIAGDYIRFIQKNELYEPKENYTILFKYLSTLFNHLKSIDSAVIDSTLSKLYIDFEYIYELHANLKINTLDLKVIFQKKFIYKSTVLRVLEKEINRYKNIVNISLEEKKALKQYTQEYEQLQDIYFRYFEDTFTEEKKYFLSILLDILNTKTFYLDKLLWMQVSKSDLIMRRLNMHKKINSKIYLTYKLTVILPYSKDYEYFQKCLRIFK